MPTATSPPPDMKGPRGGLDEKRPFYPFVAKNPTRANFITTCQHVKALLRPLLGLEGGLVHASEEL